MKRIQTLIALALCLALTLSAYLTVQAQRGDGTLLGAYEPDSATSTAMPTIPEGTSLTEKRMALDNQLGGQSVRTELTFALVAKPQDAAWSELTEKFAMEVSEQIASGAGRTAEELAGAIRTAVGRAIDEPARTLAGGEITLANVTVTTPYFEPLQRGSKSDAARALQEKLIQLGYLEGTADGQFGKGTAAAVSALEDYVRLLEQDDIDAKATPTPAPTPTPDPSATPDPNATPAPTPMPAPTPVTKVDGVADSTLLNFLMSADFPSARSDLKYGDKGDAVLRFQRRLSALGYLIGKPDGFYGTGTQLSVRLLQYYNGLEQNGSADMALQKMVFSGQAKGPDHPMLQDGSSGAEVTRLQQRLYVLGFMTGKPDGSYGAATERGIENLQAYFQTQEREELTAEAMASGTPAAEIKIDESKLETVVNGVADPILMDKFYDASFPDVPGAMTNGSAGEEVKRMQRRLYSLEYLYTSADGGYGPGTANAIKDFQKRNKLSQTGEADKNTLNALFSDTAKKALKPYLLKVSIAKQRVYAYAPDENEEYTVLVRTMKCSTGMSGNDTPKGTYQATTGPGARWHYFKEFYVWAQYAYYIQGDYMFHSVLYNQRGGNPTYGSVHNLGRKASHGCVRLSVENAKWVYQNCPMKTKVIIY
jgi:peptidoglycan hydrolase-like protein with peptidoglycan-binding domain